MKFFETHKCLLCHDAPCKKICPDLDFSKMIRSLRFENVASAVRLLPTENPFSKNSSEIKKQFEEKCPAKLNIQEITEELYKEKIVPLPELKKVDISTDICGVKLENPFLLSSSVVGSCYEMIAKAFEMGWAGVSYKTINCMEMHETSPRYSATRNWDGTFSGFKNIEQLSSHTLDEDMEIFKKLKKNYPSKVLVASIMGRNEEEWEYVARRATEAGADVIELNFSCPNMEEKGVGVDIGLDPALCERFTAAARRGTNLPILAKMTPNISDMCIPARASIKGGANGIAAINTIRSIMNINLDTMASAPDVKGKSSVGGYSGRAVKPIALRFISDMKHDSELKNCHISGMGGITTWRDAVEFISLGAESLQVTTAVMEYGYRIIDDLISGLKEYMNKRGFSSIKDFAGNAVENVVDAENLERDTILFPKFDYEKCLGCGRCYISCSDGGHQAIEFDSETRKPKFNGKKCVGCHLCRLVCPAQAIGTVEKRINKL